ncbi:ComF family protein [Aliidiomarina halalkaliphila]|uniref:ComF family protein n=1 Tax=Aliidiomarina halalkaliphila TaxID=2593535 RepID=A0A552X1S2_9GAMM|nr:ComF family protein [Aliidiomarina halalkaliphila]TRW48991.1 ComF family protein [Aliidiomarina halalkaliphila]
MQGIITGWRALRKVGACWLCRQYQELDHGLCSVCLEDLPRLPPRNCQPAIATSEAAQACRMWIAALSYEAPVDRWFQAYKYGHQPLLANAFGQLLAAQVIATYRAQKIYLPEAIVPVPLSTARWFKRGYNQAQLLAQAVGELLDIPVLFPLRRRYTRESTRLHAKDRVRNLCQAFYCKEPLAVQRVALIDDVITSGATMNAAARALTTEGRVLIDGWAFAYTPTIDKK